MNELHQETPPTPLQQPDPQLSLSTGRASALQITLTALVSLLIVAVTIYGLNRPMNEPQQSASAPAAPETTGAAATEPQPQPPAGANEPAQQPQPEPVKPGQADDSAR